MLRFITRSPEATLASQIIKSQAFLDRVLKAGGRLQLSPKRQSKLHALLGVKGCTKSVLLSDVAARIRATEILFEVTRDQLLSLAPPGTPMFHITFVDDIGLTSDRSPSLKLAALKRKVYKAMRSMGLSGIVMVEVQALTNYPAGGCGRTLMLHAHALCWGNVSRRKFRAARKKLNASRSWQNHFGAQPVHSRRLNQGLDDGLRIVCYLAKMPHDGKYRVPVGKSFRFRSTLKGYPDSLALRIAEGLSHYTIYDAVFGVGSGSVIRKQWKREVEGWHHGRMNHVEKVDKFNVKKFWRRVHAREASSLYLPYEIG